MTNKTLHYTLTPVQAFVSQARRTRDLWAGSYLISYLVAKAMDKNGAGNITFPDIKTDALIKRLGGIANKDEKDLASRLGSIPNRFTAKLTDKTGEDYKIIIDETWIAIAKSVKQYLEETKKGKQGFKFDSRLNGLWDKQINHFWDHQWVVGEESYLLDQRKNLRNNYKEAEEGEKCTVCGEREELSPHQGAIPKRMNEWWEKEIQPQVHSLDLKKDERLCAVCLTKRLFPKIAEKEIGWKVPEFYPSTAYLSVIDWLISLLKQSRGNEKLKEAITTFTSIAKDILFLPQKKAERLTEISKIEKLLEDFSDNTTFKDFVNLDGDVFYLSSIQLDSYQLKKPEETKNNTTRKDLEKALNRLYKISGSKPSPFYAILFMDGDGMGALLGGKSTDEKLEISEALGIFTKKVPEIVNKNNGILTYAGGDDVFALMPVSTAMQCALGCREAYQKAFEPVIKKDIIKKEMATISAAIEYTHMNTALGVVVRDSHSLLDDIAKDKTGRDAIACRVWKRGGSVLTWTQPLQLESSSINTIELFNCVFNGFHGNQPEKFSSRFLYKLRDLFDLIQAGGSSPFRHNDIKELLITEYLANREFDSKAYKGLSIQQKRDEAEELIEPLLQLCRQHTRVVDDNSCRIEKSDKYSADIALLIRFLSQKEV